VINIYLFNCFLEKMVGKFIVAGGGIAAVVLYIVACSTQVRVWVRKGGGCLWLLRT
jgi:hypothetical protein